MGGKMLGAAGGENGVCHLLQKLRIEGGHGDGVGKTVAVPVRATSWETSFHQ